MLVVLLPIFLCGLYPLLRAWWSNRHASLFQALNWMLAAWAAWILMLFFRDAENTMGRPDPARYLALCLTGCVGVAVLGARRPHVGAWNFVVLGLLGVMVLPLIEGLLAGVPSLDALRFFFLGATLSVGVINYLPTRLAPAIVLAGLGCALEMVRLAAPEWRSHQAIADLAPPLLVGMSPWLGAWCWARRPPPEHALDRLWLDFRNRYGLLWGQRVRDQFNAAAFNAGWPVYLAWQGLRQLVTSGPPAAKPDDMLATLRALLRRFMAPHEGESFR